MSLKMFLEIVNLRVAVVTGRNAVLRPGFHHLLEFEPSVISPRLGESGLEKTAAAAATEIVGSIRLHIDDVLFTHDALGDEAQILGDGIPQRLSHQLAGILDRELDLAVLVPFGVGFQFPFPDPSGIQLDNADDFKIMRDVEFVQSDPD